MCVYSQKYLVLRYVVVEEELLEIDPESVRPKYLALLRPENHLNLLKYVVCFVRALYV